MTPQELTALKQAAQWVLLDREVRNGSVFKTYFPDTGPLRRELYPRSLLFFMAGRLHRERLFLAANRSGKTVTAAYEITAHMTGLYPRWWPGKVYEGPGEWWCAGDTNESTRNILQAEMCGSQEIVRAGRWAGMVPPHLIVDRTLKSGVADGIDTIWVQHVGDKVGGAPVTSTLAFKAYQQGRISFQGTSKRGVWLDEEPPDASDNVTGGGEPSGNGDIYTECLLRTATTDGMVIATFTPLRGLTPFVDQYLQKAEMCDPTNGRIVNAKIGLFGRESVEGDAE